MTLSDKYFCLSILLTAISNMAKCSSFLATLRGAFFDAILFYLSSSFSRKLGFCLCGCQILRWHSQPLSQDFRSVTVHKRLWHLVKTDCHWDKTGGHWTMFLKNPWHLGSGWDNAFMCCDCVFVTSSFFVYFTFVIGWPFSLLDLAGTFCCAFENDSQHIVTASCAWLWYMELVIQIAYRTSWLQDCFFLHVFFLHRLSVQLLYCTCIGPQSIF